LFKLRNEGFSENASQCADIDLIACVFNAEQCNVRLVIAAKLIGMTGNVFGPFL
jgi:hypothetical protein